MQLIYTNNNQVNFVLQATGSVDYIPVKQFLCDHTKYGSHVAIVKSVVCLSVCHACV